MYEAFTLKVSAILLDSSAVDNGPVHKKLLYVMNVKMKLPLPDYTAWADLAVV